MSITLTALMKQRYDTAANWTAQNPTLLAGEIGIESDTKKWKVGTGATAWTSLAYAIGGTYPIVNADVAAGAAIVDTKLATIATAGKVSNSATTATNTNTASAIVARDASGNFTAGTITAALTGAASSNVLKAGDTMTGVLAVTAGTAALPGIAFDSNTGIYSPGDDQVAISTNGTGRLFVSSTGDFGVNTGGTQGTKLHVIGGNVWNSNFYEIARFQKSSGTAVSLGFDNTAYVATIGAYSHDGTASNLSFWTYPGSGSVQERLRITSTGALNFVGAGTAGSTQAVSFNGSAPVNSLVIDSSGRLLVGTSSARSIASFNLSALQVEGTGSPYGGISAIANGADAFGAIISFGKSRGTTIGSNTIVANNDVIGELRFAGADGSDLDSYAALISCQVDGTPGTNDMPGRLVFSTTEDGAASPTERMRITNAGSILSFAASANDAITAGVASGAGATPYLFAGVHSRTGTATGGTLSYSVAANGNVQNTNGSYTTISDAKLKENIVDAGSQWDDFKVIRICNWNYKAETGHQTHRQIGPIANELEAVCPGLVFETPDRDEDGNETGEVTKGVNQSVLYMKAVKALQEAMERIETLEASNADMLARLTALEAA